MQKQHNRAVLSGHCERQLGVRRLVYREIPTNSGSRHEGNESLGLPTK